MSKLDYNEFNFNYARSSGKGGQNVNKTNTKAMLTWHLGRSNSLTTSHKERFSKRYPNFININGEVVLSSQEHRTQTLNREECIKKISRMIENTRFEAKKRKPTKATRGSVERRIKTKKLKGLTKKLRREKF